MEQPGTATHSSHFNHICQYIVFMQKSRLSARFKKSSENILFFDKNLPYIVGILLASHHCLWFNRSSSNESTLPSLEIRQISLFFVKISAS